MTQANETIETLKTNFRLFQEFLKHVAERVDEKDELQSAIIRTAYMSGLTDAAKILVQGRLPTTNKA